MRWLSIELWKLTIMSEQEADYQSNLSVEEFLWDSNPDQYVKFHGMMTIIE